MKGYPTILFWPALRDAGNESKTDKPAPVVFQVPLFGGLALCIPRFHRIVSHTVFRLWKRDQRQASPNCLLGIVDRAFLISKTHAYPFSIRSSLEQFLVSGVNGVCLLQDQRELPAMAAFIERNAVSLQVRLHIPVFKAHRLLYHSTLGLRVITKKKKTPHPRPPSFAPLRRLALTCSKCAA